MKLFSPLVLYVLKHLLFLTSLTIFQHLEHFVPLALFTVTDIFFSLEIFLSTLDVINNSCASIFCKRSNSAFGNVISTSASRLDPIILLKLSVVNVLDQNIHN